MRLGLTATYMPPGIFSYCTSWNAASTIKGMSDTALPEEHNYSLNLCFIITDFLGAVHIVLMKIPIEIISRGGSLQTGKKCNCNLFCFDPYVNASTCIKHVRGAEQFVASQSGPTGCNSISPEKRESVHRPNVTLGDPSAGED